MDTKHQSIPITKEEKFQQILESYNPKPIKSIRRIFYPRNFELSPEFVKAFEVEKRRLLAKGVTEKEIKQKITKALLFH